MLSWYRSGPQQWLPLLVIIVFGSGATSALARELSPGDTYGGSHQKLLLTEGYAVSDPAPAKKSAWKPLLEVGIHQAYDSNVYWYPEGPLANRASWVTSVLPVIGIKYQHEKSRQQLMYAPDIAFYHDESVENYVRHRFMAQGHQQWGQQWSVDTNFLLYITDGSDESLIWNGMGGAPAFGGYESRNRRDQLFSKHHVAVKYEIDDDWFVRGRYDGKFRDFRIKNRASPGYLNFYDRDEITGGVEIGRQLVSGLSLYVGYRFGAQDQENRRGGQVNYSNTFHRLPVGLEGQPLPWLKLAVEVAPDLRNFGNDIAPGSPASEVYTYVDSRISLYPTRWDTVELKHTRFLMPSSEGAGMFEDILYEVCWNRKYEGEVAGLDLSQISTMVGFQVYEEDFFPGQRRERRFSPKLKINYQLGPKLTAALDYSYEWTESDIANTPAREYRRHLFGLTVKMTY
jgi:hypothetical protein